MKAFFDKLFVIFYWKISHKHGYFYKTLLYKWVGCRFSTRAYPSLAYKMPLWESNPPGGEKSVRGLQFCTENFADGGEEMGICQLGDFPAGDNCWRGESRVSSRVRHPSIVRRLFNPTNTGNFLLLRLGNGHHKVREGWSIFFESRKIFVASSSTEIYEGILLWGYFS